MALFEPRAPPRVVPPLDAIVVGAGLFHDSSFPALLNGSSLIGNLVSGGSGPSGGNNIFNGANISYVLPAPLGHWAPGGVECREITCANNLPCLSQPCDLSTIPQL